MRKAAFVVWAVFSTSCGGGSPTAPTPTSQVQNLTRIIGLNGNMSFSNVVVGRSASATLTISNTGSGPLTVTGLSGPSAFSANWTTGTIAAGGSQAVTVNFAPTTVGDHSGTITVSANHTSGSNVIGVAASGVANVLGAWSGTQTVNAIGQSAVCGMTWIVNDQQGINFRGTWQSSGTQCGQSGILDGVVTSNNNISGLRVAATVSPSPCTRVAGDGQFNGVLSATTITVQTTETIRCSGLGDITRTMTLQVRRQ